jgi:hypothetical protein
LTLAARATYFDGPDGFKERKVLIFNELTDFKS